LGNTNQLKDQLKLHNEKYSCVCVCVCVCVCLCVCGHTMNDLSHLRMALIFNLLSHFLRIL